MINVQPSMNNQNMAFGKQSKESDSTLKGYLVHENPIQATKSTVKNYAQTAKYAVDAVNGKGDDYSVGKINDLTTRAGSFGIAAILASMTRNPAAKTMEFAGFASFFAAMTIWPKAFIAAPLKAKTGFNVNQQYVDSYDRRKRFFEDAQYLPWDLYNSEEINKIGDKLKIPTDIENREKHTQEKMKQIATQSNTLWMLTAGISTPLMASLMGNYASKYVNKVIETSRAKSSIKAAGLEDFTGISQSPLQKIFVSPLANLLSLGKKNKASESPEETLKILDRAYDSIFGKMDDAEYEYNKARLLYPNVSEDKMLTQYDEKLGAVVVKDSNGKVTQKIKTKNVDGISIFGNKWQEIPNKLADALNVSPKQYKNILAKTLKADGNGVTPNESEVLADTLISEFGGSENKGKLKKALLKMETILGSSIEELDEASNQFSNKLGEVGKNYNKQDEINKFIVKGQHERLENKVVNTKTSWFNPVRILDILAQHSDESAADVASNKELKETLTQFIYGVRDHHINNNFEDVIKGDFSSENYRYSMGIEKFFAPLSDKTKEMLPSNSKLSESIDKNTNWLASKLYEIADKKGNNFDSICQWLGKTPYEFIADATKQNGIYRGWLKTVGVSFAVLTGVTWIAISQFGKTNKYNQDIYRQKAEASNEQSGGV